MTLSDFTIVLKNLPLNIFLYSFEIINHPLRSFHLCPYLDNVVMKLYPCSQVKSAIVSYIANTSNYNLQGVFWIFQLLLIVTFYHAPFEANLDQRGEHERPASKASTVFISGLLLHVFVLCQTLSFMSSSLSEKKTDIRCMLIFTMNYFVDIELSLNHR